MRPTRQKKASGFLTGKKSSRDFDTFAGLSPTAPHEHVLARVLITLILYGPKRLFRGTVKSFVLEGWRDVFSGKWGKMTIHGGEQYWDDVTFEGLIKQQNPPPDDDWDGYHLELAKLALQACGSGPDRARGLLVQLGRPVARLEESFEIAFGYALGRHMILRSDIDTVLSSLPFWLKEGWTGAVDPEPSKKVSQIVDALKGPKRVVYVRGEAFCAKRDVLKGVVHAIKESPIPFTGAGVLPVFGRALGGISSSLFVDDVFDYFALAGSMDAEVRGHLDTEGKIAVIRAAAALAPALFIVSDVEPFDRDSVVRRLSGHRVADVLAAIVENGHPETRVLIGVRSDSDDLPWPEKYDWPFRLEPSSEEFAAAVAGLPENLKVRLDKPRPLSGMTMRLSMPIIRLATEDGGLAFADEFVRALDRDGAKDVFALIWEKHLDDRDRFLQGLIACSQDGLRISTLQRLMETLRRMLGPVHDKVLAEIPDLRQWQKRQDDRVLWRKIGRSTPDDDLLYVREQLRPLILEKWERQFSDLARAALWCVAREAFSQARNGIIEDGIDGLELAYSRKLQAINALLASIDTAKIDENKLFERNRSSAVKIVESVLPPLSFDAPMPEPGEAYRYAWTQLFQLDIDARSQRGLSFLDDDPLARLDALLPFVRPALFWEEKPRRRLCQDGSLSVRDLGPAAKALRPAEQIELLTAIALAALNSGSIDGPHLIRDAAWLARKVKEQSKTRVSDRAMLRVLRAEVDLGLLCGGNPDFKITLPHEERTDKGKESYRLESVAIQIESIIADIEGRVVRDAKGRKKPSQNDCWVLGKWHARLGEARQLQGKLDEANSAFRKTFRYEFLLSHFSQPGSATPTIIGGRTARRMVRHLLQYDVSNFTIIQFPSDGLAWPAPGAVPGSLAKDNRWRFKFVSTLLDINRTRVSRGSWSDRIGVILDDVRVAMAKRDFDAAQKAIKLANSSTRGAGYEALLELAMLRASLEIEHAMAIGDVWSPKADAQKLQDLTQRRAALEDMLRSFEILIRRIVSGSDELEPYVAFLKFLRAQADIVQSRIAQQGSAERNMALRNAVDNLKEAIGMMKVTGYLCHLQRAEATLSAVNNVIAGLTPNAVDRVVTIPARTMRR